MRLQFYLTVISRLDLCNCRCFDEFRISFVQNLMELDFQRFDAV